MPRLTPIRCLTALSIALCYWLHAQAPTQPPASQLPANLPTTQTSSQPLSLQLVPPLPPPPVTHRADVSFTSGQLSVSADNSSLNQILRDISRQTGMKITGGVTDEHVFGKYGPGPPSQVLATLLNGTGSNVLLVQDGAATPTELILTPRVGGVTPPNPNAPGFNDTADSDDPPQHGLDRVINRAPARPGRPDPNRPDPPPSLLPYSPPAAAPGTTQEQSPNGVKTPQQIYDQLMRMRQQSQQQPAPQ